MIDDDAIGALEEAVARAVRTRDQSALRVLGLGEISLVLGWPDDNPCWACKRLPPFPSSEAARRYAATLDRYVEAVRARGVDVVETTVHRLPGGDGTVALYCVQPVLPAGALAVDIVRRDEARAPEVLGAIVDAIFAVVDDTLGLDAQLSNWAIVDGRLVYFDVTTPLLRGPGGQTELDAEVFLASLPWSLRAAVRRFVLPELLARYHQPRTVVLDLAANLVKERLDRWIHVVLDAAGDRIEPPLTEGEVRRDYRSDARTWAVLQALRRADRAWQHHVRRRPYPFLLPGRIER